MFICIISGSWGGEMEIGLIYLKEKPLDVVPKSRLRALQNEAFTQGYELLVPLHNTVNYHSQTIKAHCSGVPV